MKKLFFFGILFVIAQALSAQYKQGLKYYNKGEYYRAIPKFTKVVNSNDAEKTEAAVKLADCYLQLKEYANAEVFYKKAIESGKVDAAAHFNYATVLKNNNHYNEALEEFNAYLKQYPNDARAKNALKYCKEIKAWQSLPKEYEAVGVAEINTPKSEFCPVIYDNKLVFVSEQKPDIVNYEQYDFNGHPYLNVFFTELKNEVPSTTKKTFSKVNSNYHDGPVCFNKEQNVLYMTRVNYIENKKDKDFVNRAKLFVSEKSGKSWGSLKPFAYNSDSYSVAHPSLSEDGNYLFFSSDMPGGQGGMDIWECKKGKDGWEKPVNLGPDINTSGNEEFPFMRKDGLLFFASDGLPGFGGYDIFSAKQIAGKWILNRNEGLGINSFADDFGIYFIDNFKGYVSSNRDGSLSGSDDIYKFTFAAKLISLDGTILKSQNIFDPVANIKVFLEDEGGTHLNDTRTNEQGYFRFDNLSPDRKYMVKIDEADPAFNGQKHYYYADGHNQVMRVTLVNDKGEKHVFRNLPVDANSLPDLTIPDDITLGGNLLYGENPSNPIANKQITLKDGNGNVIEQVTTNAFGSFVFSKLPPDENYLIELSELDGSLSPDTKIILTNKSGKQVKIVRADAKGGFNFSLLAADKAMIDELKVNDADLLMDLTGKLLGQDKASLGGAKIYLMDEKGTALDTVLTDVEGKFEFRKLQTGKNYLVNVDEADARLNGMDKLFISDLKGKIVKELVRNKYKGFSFNLLESEKNNMKQIYVDDPWLEVLELKDKKNKEQITIVENVYYGLNEYKFDDDGQRVMDKVVAIMRANPNLNIEISSHTDSRAADKFNLTLSQKRAKYAVDYIISKGIQAKRLTAVGYGESKLINKCGNNVQCTEEEHAQNRRTEFKIVDAGKK